MVKIGEVELDLLGNDEHLRRTLRDATKSLEAAGRRMREIGTNLTAGITLPIAAIGFTATRAAIQFESSFAGIRKTMDLTEAEFDRLAAANRRLAQEIPVAVNELNRIGELAGQLGIRGVGNVLEFEETIAQLAVTTDLTADSAALSFAQIANILELPQDQIDRLGAAIVGLGNNFATVESQIVEFTTRIAGAGKIAGLSAGDVAGIGTAFASLGVNAEAGGTAVQKVLLQMVTAVSQGGDALRGFADAAGVTTEEFRRAFEEDAAGVFVRFVEGLARQGDDAVKVLDELGLVDQRLTRAFLAAAGAGDLLRRAVEQGNREFRENTALTTEAEKRFATTESQLRIFQNTLNDVAITFGNALIPALTQALEASRPLIEIIRGAAEGFADLHPLIQTAAIAAAALAAAAGPVVVVLGQLSLVIGAVGPAFVAATTAVAGFTAALLTNPVFLAIAAGIAAVAAAVSLVGRDAAAAKPSLDEFNKSLKGSAELARELDEALQGIDTPQFEVFTAERQLQRAEAALKRFREEIGAEGPGLSLGIRGEDLAKLLDLSRAVTEAKRRVDDARLALENFGQEKAAEETARRLAERSEAISETMAELETRLNVARANVQLFGDGFDFAGAQLSAMESALQSLLEIGLRPTNATVVRLAENIRLAREEITLVPASIVQVRDSLVLARDAVQIFADKNRQAAIEAAQAWLSMQSVVERFEQFGRSTFIGFGNAVADFATGATDAFEQFVDEAIRQLTRLAAQIVITLGLKALGAPTALLPIPGLQHGGFLRPGQIGLVGEAGPELVRAGPSGATVTPIETRGPAVSLNLSVSGSNGQSIVDSVIAELRKGRAAREIDEGLGRLDRNRLFISGNPNANIVR